METASPTADNGVIPETSKSTKFHHPLAGETEGEDSVMGA